MKDHLDILKNHLASGQKNPLNESIAAIADELESLRFVELATNVLHALLQKKQAQIRRLQESSQTNSPDQESLHALKTFFDVQAEILRTINRPGVTH